MGSLEVIAFPMPANHCRPPALTVAQSDGAFNDVSPIRLVSFTDGLSHTLVMVERSTTVHRILNDVNPDLSWKVRLVYHGQLGRHAVHNALSAQRVQDRRRWCRPGAG